MTCTFFIQNQARIFPAIVKTFGVQFAFASLQKLFHDMLVSSEIF